MNVAYEIEVGEIIRRRWWIGFGWGWLFGISSGFVVWFVSIHH